MNSSKYLSNAHTHTHMSDGHASLEQMVKAAYDLGFISLGISDHSPVFYSNNFQIKDMEEYVLEIETIQRKYMDKMEIICGIELDNDCNVSIPKGISYIISSLHTIKISNSEFFRFHNGADNFKKGIKEYFDGDFMKACEEFYKQSFISATRENTDIIGHFDSICKYNSNNIFFDENDKKYTSMAFDTIDSVLSKRPNAVFELNTGGIMRAGRTSPYPSIPILKRINEKGGKIIVNSDAHRPYQINAYFDMAFEILRSIGFKSVLRLRKNGFEELSLKE